MNSQIYYKVLKTLLENEEIKEYSAMGGGGGFVGGYSIPLGKKNKKKKKKKIAEIDVEEKLVEAAARTPRIDSLDKDQLLDFLYFLLNKSESAINITEKMSGQHLTIGVKGTSRGNRVYAADKQTLDSVGDIFSSGLDYSGGSSRHVKSAFIKYFPSLPKGETRVFQMEVIKPDYKKPDYISYNLDIITIAIYKGSISKEEANRLQRGKIKVLRPEDIIRKPLNKEALPEEIVLKLESLISGVQNFNGRGFKTYIKTEIAPEVSNIINVLFGGSILNPDSPIEGIAVNQGENFFKVPAVEFDKIQKIQSSFVAEFKMKRHGIVSNPSIFNRKDPYGNNIRASMLYDYINGVDTSKQGFGYKLLSYIKLLPETAKYKNIRIFFSPKEFQTLCLMLNEAIDTNKPDKYIQTINFLAQKVVSSRGNYRWHTTDGHEDYNNEYRTEILSKISV